MSAKNKFAAFLAALMMLSAGLAGATTVSVNANTNSYAFGWGGGPAHSGINLTAGQAFSVTVDPTQTWAMSDSGWISNANGHIGVEFWDTNPDGTSFAGTAGSLVGQINAGTFDAGNFFSVGTSFSGLANATGLLSFYYWDVDSWNNSGTIQAVVTVGDSVNVPEPGSLALVGLGLLALGRRRRVQAGSVGSTRCVRFFSSER